MVSQPSPPADDEQRLRKEFNDRRRHIHQSERDENEQQLKPEWSCIAFCTGIEQLPIEEVEPHNHADFSLTDQHEDNDHRHPEPPLQRCKWTKGWRSKQE